MNLKVLVGSGEKIGLFTLPFLLVGLTVNIFAPSLFSVGGPTTLLRWTSIAVLVFGIVNWIWSAVLILTKVPQKELITSGPYAIVKHPLYTGVALLVLLWFGFLLNTWLGLLIGFVIYAGSRMYSIEEEKILAKTFGDSWNKYCQKVILPFL